MKKYLGFFLAVLLFVSCSSNRKTVTYPNMLADIDPFLLGTVGASVDQTLSTNVKETEVEAVFYPRENEVALNFKHGLSQYRQFWNEAGRQLFIEALEKYKEDFTNQKLTTQYAKSRGIYGKANGRFQWKSLTISATYQSSPAVELGYRFRKDSPYFSVFQKSAKEETKDNTRGITDSPGFSIYFTRAQGEELAKLFDQAFLLASLEGKEDSPAASPNRDEYYREATPGNNSPQIDKAAEAATEPIAEPDSEESENEE